MNNWGGKRTNSGRPKGALGKGEKKTGRIVISCLESEEAEIKRLAESSGKTISRYLVDLALGK